MQQHSNTGCNHTLLCLWGKKIINNNNSNKTQTNKKILTNAFFPSFPFWVFSDHSVPFTGSCCFLPGGDSCLERAFLKYLKWFSEPEETFTCKQNKPGGLEHPTGGAAESSECFRTQNYSPLRQEVGIENQVLNIKSVKSQPFLLQFFAFLQRS